MADDNKLVAEPRDKFGKGAARKIRAAGKVPAVIYGHGTKPQHVTLPAPRAGPHPAQGERRARPRHRGQEPARAGQGRAEGPGAPDHRAHRPDHRPQGREGHRRRARARRGRVVPRHAGRARREHAVGRGRGHPHPRAPHGRRRGTRGGPQIYAKDVDAARGRHLLSDPDTLVVNITVPAKVDLGEAAAEEAAEGARPPRAKRARPPRAPRPLPRKPPSNLRELRWLSSVIP